MSDEPNSTGRGRRKARTRRPVPRPGRREPAARAGAGCSPPGAWCWAALLVLLVLAAACSSPAICSSSIPAANAAATAQTNVYLYSDGTQIARDGEVNRENINLSQVPKAAQHAVLAAEDRDFYTESAVDPKAMVRAGWNTLTGKGKQSGSTITQQYVKNYYLGQEQTVTRKVKEFFIAIKLDREESKDDILEGYLNTSYFGRNAYGIQAAAQAYYGKDIADIDHRRGRLPRRPAQRAQRVRHRAPTPRTGRRAVARWNYVLDGMVKKGWLSRAERATLKFPEPSAAKPATGLSGQRGYLVRGRQELPDQQRDHRRDSASPPAASASPPPSSRSGRRRIRRSGQRPADVQARRRTARSTSYVRAGGASIDPKTGKVVAMYGGIDYTKQYVNNATRRDYQVGSTFKPFVFASAVQNDSTTQDGQPHHPATPSTTAPTSARSSATASGTDYAPENEDETSYGHDHRHATPLNKSVNSVYAQMGVDVGPDKVKKTAIDLGIPENTPNMPEDGSIALGVATASTLDMAEAYATLANHGKHGHYTPRREGHARRGGHRPARPRGRASGAAAEAADTTTVRPAQRGRGRHRHRRTERRAAPPRARPAPPRRTRPPGSRATHPNWPPSSA